MSRTAATPTTRSEEVRVPGLEGHNPIGFFAALGLARIVARSIPSTLRWDEGVVPTAVIGGITSIDDLVDAVMTDHAHWGDAAVLNHESCDDIKLRPGDLRRYLEACEADGERSRELAAALVVQRVVDGKGASKPTDFHFTAGQQRFLAMCRQIRDGVTADDIRRAITGGWTYASKLPSLMWDIADDRIYALSSVNPSSEKKLTEPGAEWLALMGLTSLPVTIGPERTLTPGARGRWKGGTFHWPVWQPPLSPLAVRSLLAAVDPGDSSQLLTARGCLTLYQSEIRRADQGGYGTFGPPTVVWQAPVAAESRPDPFASPDEVSGR